MLSKFDSQLIHTFSHIINYSDVFITISDKIPYILYYHAQNIIKILSKHTEPFIRKLNFNLKYLKQFKQIIMESDESMKPSKRVKY